MPRGCKIRKRGCSSSSSSTSVLRNYRLKRSVLIGKRGGTTTPAPAWMVDGRSQSSITGFSENSHPRSRVGSRGNVAPVSARKLANALWELSGITPPLARVRRYKETKEDKFDVSSRSIPVQLSGSLHSPASELMDLSGSSGRRRRHLPMCSKKSRFSGYNDKLLRYNSNESLSEAKTQPQGHPFSPASSVRKTKNNLTSLRGTLKTSKELLMVLDQINGFNKPHSSSMSIISALHVELERALAQVGRLIEEQKSDPNGTNYLKRRLSEEKSAWRKKERETIEAAIQSIVEELEQEKKSRRRMESENKKLHMELTNAKSKLSKAIKDLHNERKTRELIEQVCDEVVKGIGDEKAEVEELKRESAKVREEIEKEREMLQLADVWREERVQMKLLEAKFELEDKNMAVDQLRNELEAFLATKRSKANTNKNKHLIEEFETEDTSCTSGVNAVGLDRECGRDTSEEEGEVGSVESDLHSIELNVDNPNKNRTSNLTSQIAHQVTEFSTVDEEANGMNSNKMLMCNSPRDHNSGPWATLEDIIDNNSNVGKHGQKLDPDAERYKSVKGLRDQMMSNSKIARGLRSPARPRIQTLTTSSDQTFVGPKISEMLMAMGSKIGAHTFKHRPV